MGISVIDVITRSLRFRINDSLESNTVTITRGHMNIHVQNLYIYTYKPLSHIYYQTRHETR